MITFVIVCAINYILFGFIEGDFNFMNWENHERLLLVLGCIIASVIIEANREENKKNGD